MEKFIIKSDGIYYNEKEVFQSKWDEIVSRYEDILFKTPYEELNNALREHFESYKQRFEEFIIRVPIREITDDVCEKHLQFFRELDELLNSTN